MRAPVKSRATRRTGSTPPSWPRCFPLTRCSTHMTNQASPRPDRPRGPEIGEHVELWLPEAREPHDHAAQRDEDRSQIDHPVQMRAIRDLFARHEVVFDVAHAGEATAFDRA